jgi:hypothetical protein
MALGLAAFFRLFVTFVGGGALVLARVDVFEAHVEEVAEFVAFDTSNTGCALVRAFVVVLSFLVNAVTLGLACEGFGLVTLGICVALGAASVHMTAAFDLFPVPLAHLSLRTLGAGFDVANAFTLTLGLEFYHVFVTKF